METNDTENKFRPAKVIKFLPNAGYGFVRDNNGKEIYFHYDEIRFVGKKLDRSAIREGLEVGIDISLTSRGARVTRLKVLQTP